MEGFLLGFVLVAAVVMLVVWERGQKQRKRDEANAFAAAAAAEAANPPPEANTNASAKKKKNKNKKKGSAKEAKVDEEALALGRGEAEASESLESRAQHYTFGHRLLRDVMLKDPGVVRATMAFADDDKAGAAIEKLWEGAGKMALATEGKRESIPGGPPKVRLLDDGFLVRLPPPRGTTECLFVAVLLDGDRVRYITLEKAPPILSKNPYTACEWTTEGNHINFGNDAVPDPTEEAFLAFARSKLTS